LYLANLKRINSYEVQEMVEMLNTHFNENVSICNNCPGQIKFAQQLLKNHIGSIPLTDIVEQFVETENEIVLPSKVEYTSECSKCGGAKKNKGARTPRTK